MKRYFFIFLSGLLATGFSFADSYQVEKKWETRPLLRDCRSVLYDRELDLIYASCINGRPIRKDGNGYIALLTTRGEIKSLRWATGLDAPKGMGLFQGSLFVTDIDHLVSIDRKTGKIIGKIPVPGAKFLNDIAVYEDRLMYVSDIFGECLFVYDGRAATLLNPRGKVESPNALAVQGDMLVIGSYKDHQVVALNLNRNRVRPYFKGLLRTDGLVPFNDQGDWLVSELNGRVCMVRLKGDLTPLLNTREQRINAGDIDYIPKSRLLLVPTFFDHRVMAYEILSR